MPARALVAVGKPVFGEPKSASGHRWVDLDGATVDLLRAHRDDQARIRNELGDGWVDTGLVFSGCDGQPLDPTYVSRHFDRLIARHGLLRIRLHDLRHTTASIGLAGEESPFEGEPPARPLIAIRELTGATKSSPSIPSPVSISTGQQEGVDR